MFAISRDEMLAALQHMEQHNLKYYDAHCPKCRRANRVEGRRIALFFPDWKNKIREMERQSAGQEKAVEKPAVKAAGPAVKTSANKAGGKVTTVKKTTSAGGKAKPAAAKATKTKAASGKPAAKKPAPAKAAARKPAPAKPAARKPATTSKIGTKASGGLKKK
jgi:hypothetical protein